MSAYEITLIALEVRKWDLEARKITLVGYYLLEDEEENITFDVSILQPPEMVEEFLGKLRYAAEHNLKEKHQDDKIEVDFDNETFLRQKIYNYFKRITMELNNPRRKKGQPKLILTTHMDVYNENQDVSFLPQRFQFYIILNWARKYYVRDDTEGYKKAIDPLRKLIRVTPDYGLGYKMLARSLKKVRKYDEAMRMYEKYAEVDNSLDARLDLAKSYRKGKLFDKSEEIYQTILADHSDNKEARIGIAQIYYATNQDKYLGILDELYQEDKVWLKEWLMDEFNFRIYVSEKTLLSPIQAAKFMGFQKIFELTQKAFKNDIPSHFNPTKARMSFYKEELENWAMVMNRFECLKEPVNIYPEKLDQDYEESPVLEEEGSLKETAAQGGTNNRQLTRVEEILMQIRARKAQRAGEANSSASSGDDDSKKGDSKSRSSKNGKAKTQTSASKKLEEASENDQSQSETSPPSPGKRTSKKSTNLKPPEKTDSKTGKDKTIKQTRRKTVSKGKSESGEPEKGETASTKKKAPRKKAENKK
jgi:tetratricopeptide (TPR) repeat protein